MCSVSYFKGDLYCMKKVVCLFCLCLVLLFSVCGCSSQSFNVNYNLSQAANNFEVLRKITVYNSRTDLVIMEMEGLMSLSNNSTNELIVTCKVGEDLYKKNYIFLNEYVIYVVEDITGTVTDPYHYKVHFYTAFPDIDVNE